MEEKKFSTKKRPLKQQVFYGNMTKTKHERRKKMTVGEARLNTVAKSNDLILNKDKRLSTTEQRVVLFLVSQITPYDEEFKEYKITMTDFCRICGIDPKNGKARADIKKAIYNLHRDIGEVEATTGTHPGMMTTVSWIEKPYWYKGMGRVIIRLDENLRPYLLKLREKFTRYEILWTLEFRSKYAARLYELAKCIRYNELEDFDYDFDLEDLQRKLGSDYKTWQDFKVKVLEVSIKEINKHSDIILSYKKRKKGREVVGVNIKISTVEATERMKREREIQERLGNENQYIMDGF